MEKQIVLTEDTDIKTMVISPAVRLGNIVFVSGQAGLTKEGKAAGPDLVSQARQAFKNLGQALTAAGSSWEKVVKVNCYLTNPKRDFQKWNEFFKEYFPKDPPARTTVGISSLVRDEWLIEVELIAEV